VKTCETFAYGVDSGLRASFQIIFQVGSFGILFTVFSKRKKSYANPTKCDGKRPKLLCTDGFHRQCLLLSSFASWLPSNCSWRANSQPILGYQSLSLSLSLRTRKNNSKSALRTLFCRTMSRGYYKNLKSLTYLVPHTVYWNTSKRYDTVSPKFFCLIQKEQ